MVNKVLVIGGGGREHAICRKLLYTKDVGEIFVSPGNAGTATEAKCKNIALNLSNLDDVCNWCKANAIDLVFVGPEDPLANGIANKMKAEGILCFGPTAEAALIEASKSFAKDFMARHNIPTAKYRSFTDAALAIDYINKADFPALVVKASGLAAGKGVVVASNKEEACAAVRSILQDKIFGAAGETVVVEEKLEGQEVSCLAFTDGQVVACMPPAQDHKQLLDGDKGPNTGGMGAFCPCHLVTSEHLTLIEREVLQKTVDGLRSEGRTFQGVLYAGVMLTKDGPRVLEFNCRLGDPETQVLLPLLESDLYEVARACALGTLDRSMVRFNTQRTALCIVAVAKGYPDTYAKGDVITGVDLVGRQAGGKNSCYVIHAGTKIAPDNSTILTNGGRVLAVVADGDSVAAANARALSGLSQLNFSGINYRRDIGLRGQTGGGGLTYAGAGVDVEAGDAFVRMIGPSAAATKRAGCLAELGSFGALFDVASAGYKRPILVSGTDGVGTKLKVAQAVGQHGTVGQDLVAMCVNDVLCHGAEPLFFLDYYACGRLDPTSAAEVVRGIADGCGLAGCALVGGETAEMPGMYAGSDYDLAGFAVGAVEADAILPRLGEIVAGDRLVGVASSGLHSNGFSLVRKVVERAGVSYADPAPFDTSRTLGEVLMTPTRIYPRSILPALRGGNVKGLAHITGGGLPGNLPRILPPHLTAELDASAWHVHPVFSWLAAQGGLSQDEWSRAFNLGLGLVLVVAPEVADSVVAQLTELGERATVVGRLIATEGGRTEEAGVRILNLPPIEVVASPRLVPVGVLISGSGTNLQALIDHCADPARGSRCRLAVVISNVPGVAGLERAAKAGIATKVIRHQDYGSRGDFEEEVDSVLREYGCELVCLAGFMRILSPLLVGRWRGRLLNIHPSLLPSFRGAHAHKLVLASGVRVTGATVHFVIEDVDAGGIVAQGSTVVAPKDTEETLAERVKLEVEHKIFPQAMELVARGACTLQPDNRVIWQ